jgi:hypothetical protein
MVDLAEPQKNGTKNGTIRDYVSRMRELTKSVSARNRKIHSKTRGESRSDEPTPSART